MIPKSAKIRITLLAALVFALPIAGGCISGAEVVAKGPGETGFSYKVPPETDFEKLEKQVRKLNGYLLELADDFEEFKVTYPLAKGHSYSTVKSFLVEQLREIFKQKSQIINGGGGSPT